MTVQVTVASGDGRAYRVVLATPATHPLSVPDGGRVSVLVCGQNAERHARGIDGARQGILGIGGEPGL